MESLKGKTALVTGGSRGIGEAIVRRFAQAGANVAFTYHSSAERAEAIAADCAAMGVKAIAYKSDAALMRWSTTPVSPKTTCFSACLRRIGMW
jgi:3-oxoacyl-[acyl-carrier protein] reductase